MGQILLSLLFVTSVFAQMEPIVECSREPDTLVLTNFSREVLELLPTKKCPTNEEKIQKLVEDEHQKFFGKLPQVKKVLNGKTLIGSEKHFSIAKKMFGSNPPKAWAQAGLDCKEVLCVFENLVGSKEAAMQLFNFHEKTGYVLSLDQTINKGAPEQIWSKEEIREMDAFASKLPSELKSLPRLPGIERQTDGYKLSDHSSSVAAYAKPGSSFGKAQIVTYDNAHTHKASGNPYEKVSWPQEVAIHELCHQHDFKGLGSTLTGSMISEKSNSLFRSLSGWKEKTGPKGESKWVADKNAEFVSWYAETEPAEDYAETCMNYILNPDVLKNKAPKKYAYMKEHLFNGKEFLDKPWSGDYVKEWPSLLALVEDESLCQDKLKECISNVKYDDGKFCLESKVTVTKTETSVSTTTSYSCGNPLAQIQNNECFKKFKNEQINLINSKLVSEENYCPLGGPQVIEKQKDKICQNAVKDLATNFEKVGKIDLAPLAKECEEDNDFTEECVLNKSGVSGNAESALILKRIPNRTVALGQKLSSIKSSLWLKSCLDTVKSIELFTTTNSKTGEKTPVLSYSSTKKDVSSSFLGKYINIGREKNDVNAECSKNIMATVEASGIKTSNTKTPTDIMQKPFTDELESFEKEVLLKISDIRKSCRSSKCETEALFELMKSWESNSPEMRVGFSSKVLAEKISKNFTRY